VKQRNEGISLDRFFRSFGRQSIPIQSNEKADSLLGPMLDKLSSHGETSRSVSGYSFSSREPPDKRSFMSSDDLSAITDHTPDVLLHGADDGSVGEVPSEESSESSWEPCDDIWDERQSQTAKTVEMARRVPTKRTGKELWQIVRDNRRVLIGKGLRMEDIVIMAKRPWRKAPPSFAERVGSAPDLQTNNVRPKEDSRKVKHSSKSSKKEKKHRSSSEKELKSERTKASKTSVAKSTITRHSRNVEHGASDCPAATSVDNPHKRHARKAQRRSTSKRQITEHSLGSVELSDMVSPITACRAFLERDRSVRSIRTEAASVPGTKDHRRGKDPSTASIKRGRRRSNDQSAASSKDDRRTNDPSVKRKRDRLRSRDPSVASSKDRHHRSDPSLANKMDPRRSNDASVSSSKDRRHGKDPSEASKGDRRIFRDPPAASVKDRRHSIDALVA
jgi:hypothetical protein